MKPKSTCSIAARCRTARGAERVNRLQDEAAELFLSCGYEGVSVDTLIHRVGGSRRNIYGHYGGKQGLFVAAVRAMGEEITEQLAALPMDGADARSGMLLYGTRLLELVLQPRMLAMHRLMVSEGERFPEQARLLCNNGRNRATAALAQWMARHQASGELRADAPALDLAQHFINLIVCGPQVRALVGELPPGWTAAGIGSHVETTVDFFLRGAAEHAAARSPSTPKSNTEQGKPTP